MAGILLLGGTGGLGRALVSRLLVDGHDLTLLSRDPVRARDLLPSSVRLAPVDQLEALVPAHPVVINLAGEPILGRWTAARWARIEASRVALTQALAGLVEPGSVWLNASAIGIYGDRADEELDHRSSAGSGRLAELCQAWEAPLTGARSRGVRSVALRTGIVLDPGSGALASMLFPFRAGLGGPMGSGDQWQSWVHVQDWVDAVAFAMSAPLDGPVDVVSPQPVRQREFASALGAALGRPAVLPVPAMALRLAIGPASELLLASQRVQPTRLLEAGFRFAFPTLVGALADLLADGGTREA